MPKLAQWELGGKSRTRCRRAGCRRNASFHGHGSELPFCAEDLRALTRSTFDALVSVAHRSVYDIDAVAEAAALVANARLELRGKLKKS